MLYVTRPAVSNNEIISQVKQNKWRKKRSKTMKSSWRSETKQTLIFKDYQQENLCAYNLKLLTSIIVGRKKQNGASMWFTQSIFTSVLNSNKPNEVYHSKQRTKSNSKKLPSSHKTCKNYNICAVRDGWAFICKLTFKYECTTILIESKYVNKQVHLAGYPAKKYHKYKRQTYHLLINR